MLSSKTLYQAETYPPLVKHDCNDSKYIKASVEHKCRITELVRNEACVHSFIGRIREQSGGTDYKHPDRQQYSQTFKAEEPLQY